MNTRLLLKQTILSALVLALFGSIGADGAEVAGPSESEFVDVKSVAPTILVELRYATPNNFTRRPLYRAGMPAMVRLSVARRLAVAQKFLEKRGYGLKIWDAYRPKAAQAQLWKAIGNHAYVADPKDIGSMHTRGAAVDVTLVDGSGREMSMPTEFDNFTPAAMIDYRGRSPVVRSNLKMLQKAMAHGGFYGLRTEWWHFCAADWTAYQPVPDIQLQVRAP
ncbi:MAG TPA: M15 family metallopeptidase [Chthoniobacterales bacterium]|nr:M15 family metallopeptidase [Chthoniobacterales bacterium]